MKITSKDIYELACEKFGLNLKSKKRDRDLVYYRAIAIKLCKELTKESLAEIGKNFNRDHATVLFSLRKFEDNYVHQKEPVNVQRSYHELLNTIIDVYGIDKEPVREPLLQLSKDELINKITQLKAENEVIRRNALVLEDENLKYLYNFYNKLTFEQKNEFINYRVKPFEKIVKSRTDNLVVKV